MTDKLGILVGTDKYLDHVINITDAAHAKGKKVQIFFTGTGVLLTRDHDFKKLAGKAKLSVCDESFRGLGLSGDVPGLEFKDFVTQAKNVELINTCDRYVVF
jgi:predicted peroxiredoxin